EEILDFLRFLGHSAQIKTLTDVNVNKLFQQWRSFAAVINKCLTGKSSGFDSFSGTQESKEEQQDVLPKIHKSHHPSLHDEETFNPKKKQDIRNTKAYKEYYACATREAAPKPKASAKRKMSDSDTSITPPDTIPTPITTVAAVLRLTAAAKGKQPAKAKCPSDPSEAARTKAEQLKIVLRRSRKETHISQHGGSSTDEGTGSKPGGRDESEGEKTDESDDDDDAQKEAEKVNDAIIMRRKESEDEKTREHEEESFDPIPRTPEDNEDDDNNEE
nr:hypothetical protein [Tanacetum cinerariifolium]